MVQKRTKVIDTSSVRALDPKDPDTIYLGTEPLFTTQPEDNIRNITIGRGFNWYSRFFNKKDAKNILIQCLELMDKKNELKTIKKVDESNIVNSYVWLYRMKLRGLKLTEQEQNRLDQEIKRLIQTVEKPQVKLSHTRLNKEEQQPVATSNRMNVQEIMKEKTREVGGELEGMLDEFILLGAPTKHTFKPIEEIAKKNILPQHVNMLTDAWRDKLNEFTEVLTSTDEQVVEGYSNFTKAQVKNIIKFIDLVLSDLNSYINVKKVNKTPRTRKPVSVEKQVSKLKYLREFKDEAQKLDLTGLHPVKLHGSSEAWVYDTLKRKLHHYIADEYSKTFTVKGNTLVGFDNNKSQVKTLRNPSTQIKEIMGSKPAARKFFDSIKAVATIPNGRFNENLIILKAF
jgi:hypothetical protein